MKITGTAILRDYHRANDFQVAAEVTDSGMNLAPRRLLRGAKRQGIIGHPVNDFLLHDLQYQSDKLSRQPQLGPVPFLQPFVITAPVIAHRDDQVGFGYKACWGEHRPDQQ
ncbi:hypothetical protein, partial [Thiolapillus sp.]|uniref:hypothetical protein n=1 Tax=Thiolapillus sp. TaxID=2017437 RepID=UPI003AF7AABC